MKRDEPYNPYVKSSGPPEGLEFRLAQSQDREAVARLMGERNLDQGITEHLRKMDREIARNAADPQYRLFVAELDGRVVGLCRYYHSSGLSKEKRVFPAPEGWYCAGIAVAGGMRRRGIARFLFQNRLKSMKEKGATRIYSMVAAENLASVRMHQAFGFREIGRASGFLHLSFGPGTGILYETDI